MLGRDVDIERDEGRRRSWSEWREWDEPSDASPVEGRKYSDVKRPSGSPGHEVGRSLARRSASCSRAVMTTPPADVARGA